MTSRPICLKGFDGSIDYTGLTESLVIQLEKAQYETPKTDLA